jgi:hypothetical protein
VELIAHLSNHAQTLRARRAASEALLGAGIDCLHEVKVERKAYVATARSPSHC